MFDFPVTQHSIGTAIFCLAVYVFVLITNYKNTFKQPFNNRLNKSTKYFNIFLAGFIIIIFCKKGDFFHLMEHVKYYSFSPFAYNYGEEVYIEIARLVDKNYFLFRAIVWGGAFILFCWTAKRMEIPIYNAALTIFCSYIVLFSYARVTAAMAVYFFGLSFLCKPIKNLKWLSYLLGVIIIYASWQFHNSAIIMIAITTVLLVPLRKWSVMLVLLLLPIIAYVAKSYLQILVMNIEGANEEIASKIAHYSEREFESSISGLLLNTMKYASFYIPIIITTITIFTKKNFTKVGTHIIRMYKVAFGIIFLASVIYLFGDVFRTIYYRTLYMAMIPLIIIALSLYKEGTISKKQFFWCYIPGLIYSFSAIVYDIYAINAEP